MMYVTLDFVQVTKATDKKVKSAGWKQKVSVPCFIH